MLYPQPIILHLDMNSYFAACEQQDNLELRGLPIGVCEHLGGIIIAPSIEAKRYGIKTGMPVWEATKLYPKIILVKSHPSRYRFYAKRVLKVVEDYTNQVEVYSIDEVFLDITRICNIVNPKHEIRNSKQIINHKSEIFNQADPFAEGAKVAAEIKRRMKREVGDWLTCSIGISYNKLLAKVASDLQKPDGLTIIRRTDKEGLYNKLKLIDIPGIGRNLERHLNRLGIQSLLDLKNYPVSQLRAEFGLPGLYIHRLGQLEGSFALEREEEQAKSIGHHYTVPKEFRDAKWFFSLLAKLCEMVARRMRKKGLCGNIVHLYFRDGQGRHFGKSQKLNFYIFHGREIFSQCQEIFKTLEHPSNSFKSIGVTVAGLVRQFYQGNLFQDAKKLAKIDSAMDKLNDKYGDFTVTPAAAFKAREIFQDSIGFGRIRPFGEEE